MNNLLALEGESSRLEFTRENALRRASEVAGEVVRSIVFSSSFWIPLVLLAMATLFFRYSDADLYLARLFYRAESPLRWPLGFAQPWKWLYNYAIYPAWIIGIGGMAASILAIFWKRIRPIRYECFFLGLLLILGPGLLVNSISKPFCGRPRPIQIKQFGGEKEFLPVLATGENPRHDYDSFPCGHASMGFYLMAPAFVFYRRRKAWAAAFLALGLAAGCTIGIARMAAGGHFASDVLWAGAFIYFTGLLLHAIFRFDARAALQEKRREESAERISLLRFSAQRNFYLAACPRVQRKRGLGILVGPAAEMDDDLLAGGIGERLDLERGGVAVAADAE
ncbi:MAG: phosphatase PAP2 family protein [Pirellulales bacterium]|nr:phosphatase PAP2 family protein [Pirellulales bacterium]